MLFIGSGHDEKPRDIEVAFRVRMVVAYKRHIKYVQCRGASFKRGLTFARLDGCCTMELSKVHKKQRPVWDRIVDCALHEFLNKGFTDASLRVIAQAAQVTTGAIYGYVAGKEALFDAVVKPAADELIARYTAFQEEFYELPLTNQFFDGMSNYENNKAHLLLDFVYDNHRIFELILQHSAGTSWVSYLDQFARLEEKGTQRYVVAMRARGYDIAPLSPASGRILATSVMQCFFAPLTEGLSRQQAHAFVNDYLRFFQAGYASLMLPENDFCLVPPRLSDT